MPVWGKVLTADQLGALTAYALQAAHGAPRQAGQQRFAKYCSVCHGPFGEGGPNPTRPNDVILPISSAEYLETRDDHTLRSIIARGQPDSGMSPFGIAYGGLLEDEEIDTIVTYIRSWQANPPVQQPPEVAPQSVTLKGPEIYAVCVPSATVQEAKVDAVQPSAIRVRCHGAMGGWDGSNYDSAMSTGDHAPVVVPGDVEGSLLARKILGTQQEGMLMPPAGKLPDGDGKVILDWIAGGARK